MGESAKNCTRDEYYGEINPPLGWYAYRTLLVLATDGKGVLEDGVDDAANTEGGLNDTGGDVLARDLHVVLHKLDQAGLKGVLLAIEMNHCLTV